MWENVDFSRSIEFKIFGKFIYKYICDETAVIGKCTFTGNVDHPQVNITEQRAKPINANNKQ